MKASCQKNVLFLGIVCAFLENCSPPEVTLVGDQLMPPGVFALVGSQALQVSLLDKDGPHERSKLAKSLVSDALFEQGSRERQPHRAMAVERGVLGRSLLEHLEQQVLAARPVTQSELDEQRQAKWLLFDRPRAVRTVQLFVRVPLMADSREFYELAQKIHTAVRGKHNINEFVIASRKIETDLAVEALRVAPVAADGRVVPLLPQDRQYASVDIDYAKAAVALRAAGMISDVIGTKEGFHIIFSLEVIPALRPSDSKIRNELMKAVAASRVQSRLDAIKRKQGVKVVRTRSDLGTVLRLARPAR